MIQNNKEIITPDFNLIKKSANDLKNVLKTFFGKVYLEVKEPVSDSGALKLDNTFSLAIFHIDQDAEPIYNKINSVEDLKSVKKYIIEKYSDDIVDKYWDLFEKVEKELEPDSKKTLEIIGNSFEKREKKIDSILKKFLLDDGWDVARIQKEFSIVLQKILRDLLDSTIDPVVNGMKNTGLNVYDETITILNNFLKELGVYTKEYHPGDEFTDDDLDHFLNPRTAEDSETTDKSLQHKIRDVESVAYLFEKDVVIREANIVVWRIS